MHRLRTGASGGIENALDNEVGFVDGCRADADSLVGETHMPRIGVGLGIHGNRTDTHASCRSDHTAGDFAAIGDEDLTEHWLLRRRNRLNVLRTQGNLTSSLHPCGTGRRDWR